MIHSDPLCPEALCRASVESIHRFTLLARRLEALYGHTQPAFFSSPGRTEIIGNHTDHQGGLVIAASIAMDTLGAACPNQTRVIRLSCEGYGDEIHIDLDHLEYTGKTQSTASLVAGMAEAFQQNGFSIEGFDACISSSVIPAAGVSSSASFEMLFCTMVSDFFNQSSLPPETCARMGQYAENHFWDKASGLMDQMACAIGGIALFDFSDPSLPVYQRLPYSFDDAGYRLMIVNTGKGHHDLSQEYSEIPGELALVCDALGTDLLAGATPEQLFTLSSGLCHDRAILRALHVITENQRVREAADAMCRNDTAGLLRLIRASGISSWQWLQNIYSLRTPAEQKVALALAATELFLNKINDGACRVHGGGFAGVILALVPCREAEAYIRYMSDLVGSANVCPMQIRPYGAVRVK